MFVGLPLTLAGVIALSRGMVLNGLVLLCIAPVLALPLSVQVMFSRGRRARALIVWVRKFHQGDRALAEQRLLEYAVVDWGRLITLADSSVEMDVASRMMVTWQYGVFVVCVAGLAAVAASDMRLFFQLLVLFAVFSWYRYSKRNTNIDGRDRVDQIVTAARARRRADRGSLVLRCPQDGDEWRRTIIALSGAVDAAVVSISETSPNVDWEIQTLVSVLGPDKIIALTDGTRPIPPPLSLTSVIQVPPSMGWWPPSGLWRQASLVIGTAILAPSLSTAAGSRLLESTRGPEQPSR